MARRDARFRAQAVIAASNYADSLMNLERREDAKSLLRKSIPVSQHALGENDDTTIRMRALYAQVLYAGGTLNDVREAVTMLEDMERTARRVLGGAHPLFGLIEDDLRRSRAALAARETPSPGGGA